MKKYFFKISKKGVSLQRIYQTTYKINTNNLKKIFKIAFKAVLGFIAFVALYLLSAFSLSRISIDREANTKEEITIYILSNGVHTDLVLPIRSELYDWSKEVRFENTVSKDTAFNYLAMGWGDKGFYLETPDWSDLKASVAFKAAFALSTTAIHTTYYKTMTENEKCKKIKISKEQYKRLTDYILESFQKDKEGHLINIATKAVYGKDDAFYEAQGSYSMLHTCNTWANNGLRKSGQKHCFWTPFDTGIFLNYK
jgi:uncharacterized protein (TIGR02117 family)